MRSCIATASVPVSRATGEKPMCPPSSPPYQPVIVVDVEVRDAGLDPVVRVLERRELLRRVLLAPDLGAGDPLERRLHLREAVVDDGLVAVEGEAHDPAPDLELLRHAVDHLVRDRLVALPPRPSGWRSPTPSRSCSRSAGRSRSSGRASECAGCRPAGRGRRRARRGARAACSTPARASARRPSS